MDTSVYSAECLHRMHSACRYEDCACRCHLQDLLEGLTDDQAAPDDEFGEDEGYPD